MSNKIYKTECYGKINLSLLITGVSNGLHELDSVMATIDMKDKLTLYPGTQELQIEIVDNVGGIDKEKYKRVLYKTISKLKSYFGNLTGKLVLDKGVPLGAGLGGSTASLVCLIKIFQKYFQDLGQFAEVDNRFLCDIGSDVPFMYVGGVKRVLGVGDKVLDINLKSLDIPKYALLIFASEGVDSKACYNLYDDIVKGNYDVCKNVSIQERINNPKNSLEIAAKRLNNEIEENISMLKAFGASKVSMTGSGSAIYTLSNSKTYLEDVISNNYSKKSLKYKIVEILM